MEKDTKKARILTVKDAKDLKVHCEVLNKEKVRFVVTAFVAKDGLLTYRFTTDPIVESKRVKIVAAIRKAMEESH